MTEPQPRLSIIIPAHNEEIRLRQTLEALLASEWVQKNGSEIIVVDDGSTDATSAVVHAYADRHPSVRLLRNQPNRGKGYSVRRGFMAARGEVVLFTDADLSYPVSAMEKLLAALHPEGHIVIASRLVDREKIEVQRPRVRGILSRAFGGLSRLVLGLPFKDPQCGLKGFVRVTCQGLFRQQQIDGFAFDCELLFLAWKRGLHVLEVGVNSRHISGSKVGLLINGFGMIIDLVRIRWWWLTGAYSKEKFGSSPQPTSKLT
ncbi:MAG: dolichyl-phosphate beta-glucosyltransferase [Candidatus Acidoferrales bacterium]